MAVATKTRGGGGAGIQRIVEIAVTVRASALKNMPGPIKER